MDFNLLKKILEKVQKHIHSFKIQFSLFYLLSDHMIQELHNKLFFLYISNLVKLFPIQFVIYQKLKVECKLQNYQCQLLLDKLNSQKILVYYHTKHLLLLEPKFLKSFYSFKININLELLQLSMSYCSYQIKHMIYYKDHVSVQGKS